MTPYIHVVEGFWFRRLSLLSSSPPTARPTAWPSFHQPSHTRIDLRASVRTHPLWDAATLSLQSCAAPPTHPGNPFLTHEHRCP